jgi:hypothetical protein
MSVQSLTPEQVVDLRKNKVSWREIGERSGISGQRAQQLYNGLMEMPPEEIAELRQSILDYLHEYGPLSKQEVKQQFSLRTVRSIMALGIPDHYLVPGTPSRGSRMPFAETFMVSCLQRAAQDLGVTEMSATMYAKWRSELSSPESVLSVPGINLRYSWREACRLAGLGSGKPRRTGYHRSWTADDALAWVSKYVMECLDTGSVATYSGYDVWQRQHKNAPCGSMVRRIIRLPWRTIVEQSAGHSFAEGKVG